MHKLKFKSKHGFTIIETALTIAVGGLIFLMIFVALPALRTQQRDTARRENVTSFIEAIKDYQSNNRGALPSPGRDAYNDITGDYEYPLFYQWESLGVLDKEDTWGELIYRTGEEFVDPEGEHYNFVIMRCGSATDVECNIGRELKYNGETIKINKPNDAEFPNEYAMYVVLQAKCYGDKAVGVSNPRKVAILYKLQGAGTYCANT